ncbi:rnb-domain-containing protein [Stemphylium lycopersici]|uniref:Rnb-domain-containing protein n=1 Tax=Stemphylium lycopersici TaxID=183478 RepID=A0A364N7A6_STELY|nr:rnb-domain-containing protein [Stemphylium lycopersici]RAR13117.1 rnb-domain-containing protein [Stemphylium lycopersici]
MYPRLQSTVGNVCLRCQWRLVHQRANISQPKIRRQLSTIKVPRTPIRSLHATAHRSQLSSEPVAASDTLDPALVPRPRNTAIRTHLEQWQHLYGGPTQEGLVAFENYPAHGQVQNVISKLSSSFKADEETETVKWDSAEDEHGEELITIGLFLKPGDVVELFQPGREPVLAVFVQQLEHDSQFFSVNGRWAHSALTRVAFAIQDCIDPALVQRLIPFMPTSPSKANPKGEVHVPRDLAAPVIAALERMTYEAERIYRTNAPVLDTAYTQLADEKRTRMMTLSQIAKTLLADGDRAWKPSPAALLAVRKALNHNEYRFRSDSRSHRLTNVFAIRPKTDAKVVELVHEWIREYRESLASSVDKSQKKPPLPTKGATYVKDFIEKARKIIAISREHREPEYGGLGPTIASKQSGPHIKITWGETFTYPDQQIISFLQAWALPDQFLGMAGLHAACASLISATGCYGPGVIRDDRDPDPSLSNSNRATGLLFLQEIGVISPHENRVFYDEQLMLPTVRQSRNVQLLNTKADLTRKNPDFRDSMADLRRDWGSTTVYCIDDANAKEIDDGISIERVKDSTTQFWVHIHVANPTAFFDKTHTLSGLAAHMTETVYTPERTYPMLPNWAAQEHFSIARNRPVLTFSSRIDSTGGVLETKIQPGIVRNVVSITPSELATLLGDESVPDVRRFVVGGEVPRREERPQPQISPAQLEELRDMHTVAQALWEQRRSAGGIRIASNDIRVHVYESALESGLTWHSPSIERARLIQGDPIIEYINTRPKEIMPLSVGPKNVVEEMMMLAGQTAAEWCSERNIPVMYRGTVAPPSRGELSVEEIQALVQTSREEHGTVPEHLAIRLMRARGRAITHSSQLPHKIIGVPGYVKVTSPLRRFSDMIAHWQIEAAVRYEAQTGKQFDGSNKYTGSRGLLPFSSRQMQESIVTLTPRERIISIAKRDSTLFWASMAFLRAFKYKEAPLPEVFNFRVRHVPEGRHLLTGHLDGYGITASMVQDGVVREGDEWEICWCPGCDVHSVLAADEQNGKEPGWSVMHERMDKCDRTKPCSACCARGSPRDCHFVAEDGNYTPIQQSYELRKLRAENLRLKERFRALKIPIDEGESDEAGSPDSQVGERLSPAQKRRSTKQKRFQSSDWQDSIYFGSPGLATVISDFASSSMDDSTTLSHTMPRPIEIFAPTSSPAYAFATLFSASPDECVPQLLSCLPAKPELLEYMDTFEQCVSAQMPAQLSRNEVERFLADARTNSQSCPAMLALLLAVIALGAQHAIWGRNGETDAAKMETEAQKGNVYKYSMTFGRPLGISGIGTCCWPQELTTDPIVLRFGDFIMQFTVLARQILSSDRLTDLRIDDFTDSLRSLLDTLPETLQFHTSWNYPNDTLPHDSWSLRIMAAVYHCKTHTYLILLNRQRTHNATLSDPQINTSAMPSFRPVNRLSSNQSSPTPPTQSSIRGRARVIASAEEILSVFFFFYQRQPSALIDWSLGQQAFNSCMLLLLDAIECQEITAGALTAKHAFAIFKELEENKVHKIARYAVKKLSWGLQRLHDIVTPSPHGIQAHDQQGNRTLMQDAKQNEATRDAGTMGSVMGHTGMQLLEDCGLQGSVRESFAPMTWGALGLPTESPTSRGNSPHHARAEQKNVPDSWVHGGDTKNSRPADVAQDSKISTTRCSAPIRYATPSDDDRMQPHGYTAPTSPTYFSRPDNQHLEASTRDHQGWQDGCSREEDRPLRCSTQWQGAVATHSAATFGRKGREHEAFPNAYEEEDRHAGTSTTAMIPPYIQPVSQRHNSCPVLSHMVPVPSLPRPTQSSTSNVDRSTASQRPHRTPPDAPTIASPQDSKTSNSHPFRQANTQRPHLMGGFFGSTASIGGHAAHPLMSSIAEAPLGFPATTYPMYPRQQDQFGFHHPTHPSNTAAHSLLTPLAETMNMDDWTRYDGGRS